MATSFSTLIIELQPYARALVDAAGAAGLLPRVTSTRRSHAEQTRLYRRYLAGLQPYFVAPPGTSPHEYGYAFDLVVSPMWRLSDVGALWESWGGYWGGRQADPVHFQYPGFHEFLASQAHQVSLPREILEDVATIQTFDRPVSEEIYDRLPAWLQDLFK